MDQNEVVLNRLLCSSDFWPHQLVWLHSCILQDLLLLMVPLLLTLKQALGHIDAGTLSKTHYTRALYHSRSPALMHRLHTQEFERSRTIKPVLSRYLCTRCPTYSFGERSDEVGIRRVMYVIQEHLHCHRT